MNLSKYDVFTAFDAVFKFIPKYKLVVSFSGNKDSVVLSELLMQWTKQYAPDFIVRLVHFAHGEARSDLMALKIAKDFAIKHELCLDVITAHIPNETHGAALRKVYFDQHIDKEKELVVTGHHLSDSVETVLINLFSGAGIKGVSGINHVLEINGLTFVRPFIKAECYQEDVDSLASLLLLNEDEDYVFDEMNFNLRLKRNYLRETIIPKIEMTFPNVQEKVNDFSKVMADQNVANEYLFKLVDEKLSAGKDMYSQTLISEMIEQNPEVLNMWFFTLFRLRFNLSLNKSHLVQFKLFLTRNASICNLPNGYLIERIAPNILYLTTNTQKTKTI